MRPMASQIIGVSSVYWTVCSGAYQGKHQSSASLAFVRGIHRWPVVSLPNIQQRGICFIWWRQHGNTIGLWEPWLLASPRQHVRVISMHSPWWLLLEPLARLPLFKSGQWNLFEGRAPIDVIYGCPILKWVAQTSLHVTVETPTMTTRRPYSARKGLISTCLHAVGLDVDVTNRSYWLTFDCLVIWSDSMD